MAIPSLPPALTRNLGALDPQQQLQLGQSHVAVIGCGGLGGYVAENLARIGVGTLSLFDPDNFSASNCNRQLNAIQATMGLNKAEATAAKLNTLNTGCKATAFPCDFRGGKKFQQLISEEPPAVIVDGLDTVAARHDLAKLCLSAELPLVHGSVEQWYGKVGVQLQGWNIMQTLYRQLKDSERITTPSVLSFTVAIIGGIQAAETVKLLLQLPSSLQNSWMEIDLKQMTFEQIAAPL